jgi:tRNA A-37 threonylcarbamoyl transferase component Bud32
MTERGTLQDARPEHADPTEGQLVAGRYRVRSLLARGGVGAVHRVFDESTGQEVALKRLLAHVAHNPRIATLFQREYQTLAEIRHPRIIEVFDYGVDAGGPYYTMQLLGGRDLDELAPIPYRDACRYLRDVTSSLALLHARHLLHRDLSPRNVRITADGRCKLLDFGTMASFGIAEEIVGTPPMVPPETLRGMPLDQRSDLYSLGALAYRILTRQYAYRARRLEELPQVWQTLPAPPSSAVSAIPPRLDALVMSMLSLDPLLRPTSATEVIDQLTAIGELAPDPDAVRTARSYLLRSKLIGRTRHIDRIKRRLGRANEGLGSTVIIEGNPGVGKTRLLDEASLHAQLVGALVLRVEARSHRGPNAVALALVRALLHAAPQPAMDAAVRHAGVLGHVIEGLGGRASAEFVALGARQRRARMQAAMLDWFVDVSRQHPLVILIDDLHRVDESSAALLAALALAARHHRIVLIATRRLAGRVAAPEPVGALALQARRLRIHRLRRQDTAELIKALFGDVPNSDTLATWIHGVTTGSPMQIMALSQHLIDRGIVHYTNGLWVLPMEVSADELPVGLAATLSARLAALPPRARRLAETLSVRRGSLSLQLCVALADPEDRADAFALVDVLVAQGVLASSSEGYTFGQEGLRDTLLAEMDPTRGRELHLRLARALLASSDLSPEEEIEAGWHLLRGGDEVGGAERLASAAPKLAVRGDATSAALPALEAALEVYERTGRSPEACLELRVILARSTDRVFSERYGDATMRMLARWAGLDVAQRLGPFVGRWLAVRLGVVTAFIRRLLLPKHRRGPAPPLAVQGIYQCAFALLPVRTAVVDLAGMKRVRRYTELLAPLGVFARIADLMLQGALGGLRARYHDPRRALDRATALLAAHPTLPNTDSAVRRGLVAAMLVIRGMLEAQHGVRASQTLEVVNELERMSREDPLQPTPDGVPLERNLTNLELYGSTLQLRIIFHVLRGEGEQASKLRESFALHGIQTGLSWLHDVWRTLLEGAASSRSGDLTSLRRAIEHLRQIVKEVPHLEGFLVLDQGYLAAALGRHNEAREGLERARTYFPAGEHAGWDGAVIALAATLIELGEPAQAAAVLHEARRYAGPSSEPTVIQCLIDATLARALAHQGEHEAAARLMDDLLGRLQGADHPMLLGAVHEAGARVAWLAGAHDRLRGHLEQMQRWYGQTRNPALLARAQRVVRLVEAPTPAASLASADEMDVATRITTHREAEGVHAILGACTDERELASTALQLLIQQAGGTEGHLYLWRGEKLHWAASMEGGEPQDELERLIHRQIQHHLDDDALASDVASSIVPTILTLTRDVPGGDAQYATLLLAFDDEGTRTIIGAVALKVGTEPLRSIGRPYLEAVAQHFAERDDVHTEG